MVKVLLLVGMTLGGVDYKPGDEIELPEKSAASAVAAEHAEYIEGTPAPGAPDGGQPGDGQQGDPDAAAKLEAEKLAHALEAKYKAEELKTAAKAAGAEFAYDATKAQVIAAVIAQGKADELLT